MDFSEGFIHIDYGGAEVAVEEMRTISGDIYAVIDQLNQDLTTLQASWVGDDKDVYTNVQAQWNGAVDNIRNLLGNHSVLLEEISENYRRNEQSRSQRWGDVRIGGS
ncbi:MULTISPECIES: WXG100 family type VII secretion target [unclassified Streptomyces]|uniref:WXG100 family type VII secretion target n=1 Tax=unclassified Streptomyces TaxID=2593676 RepID=UPI0033CA9D27